MGSVGVRRSPGLELMVSMSLVHDSIRSIGRSPLALIVDDDAAVRSVLQRWFKRSGYVVEAVADGDAARRRLTEGDADRFNVIVCDVRMPGLTGPELYAWLRIARPSLVPRVIFTTGDRYQWEVAAFFSATSCARLDKPFELGTLQRVVERVAVAA